MATKIYRKDSENLAWQTDNVERHWYSSDAKDFVKQAIKDGLLPMGNTSESIQAYAEKHQMAIHQAHAEHQEILESLKDEFLYEKRTALLENRTKAMFRNNSLDSACSVFERADRILLNQPITVVLNDAPHTNIPAWNDGKEIVFNSNEIDALDDKAILHLSSLNYHELAHLHFSPRAGSVLGKWAKELPERMHALNILEDCRAEYFLIKRYPAVRPFLINLIAKFILSDVQTMADNFLLLAGRRYFDYELRAFSAQEYADKYGIDQAKQVYRIINEYRTLVFPKQYGRAIELVEELISFLSTIPKTPSGCGHRLVPMRNGKVVGETEQKQLIGKGRETDEDLFGKSNADSQKSNRETKKQNEDTTPSVGKGKGDENGTLTESQKRFRYLDEQVAETLNKVIKSVLNDEQLKRQVRDTAKTIARDTNTKTIIEPLTGSSITYENPTQQDVLAVRCFQQELERLWIDADPAWERRRASGKLNVRRAMNADVNEINTLFDRWETGNDDYQIEAIIMIDRSGSMWGEIGSASRSAWIIKRALEKINASVTVLTFNWDSRLVMSSDKKADQRVPIVYSTGGTDPSVGLMEAERIMNRSIKPTKMLFMLTDGQFDNASISDSTIQRIKNSGVHTTVAYLGNEDWVKKQLSENPQRASMFHHNADNFEIISKPMSLVNVAKGVVRHFLTKGN